MAWSAAIAILLGAGAPRAAEIDLSGHWQVNFDCGFYATATSFLRLATDVTTGVTDSLAPEGCGTVQLPASLEKIASCETVGPPPVGAVVGSSFSLPAEGVYTTEVVFDRIFDAFACTLERLFIDLRYDGLITTDGEGNAVRVRGTISNGALEFHDPSGAVCLALADAPDCEFEMRRNDVPVGSNVTVEPRAGTTVTFQTVTAPGTVSVMPLTEPEASVPAGFQVYAPDAPVPIFYDVETTATFSGLATTCFAYPDANDDGVIDGTSPFVFETSLRVLHAEGGTFVDRTAFVDTVGNVVCGETASFSQVTVAREEDSAPTFLDHVVAPAKIVAKRSRAGTETLRFVAKDPGFLFPPGGTVSDPRTAGVTVEVYAHGEGARATVAQLGSWRISPAGDKFAAFLPRPPLRTGKLVRGRVLRIVLDATGLALAAPLDGLSVRVTTGLLRNCAVFAGEDIFRNLPGRFIGKFRTPPALADCSDASLGFPASPSGAFLDGF